MPKIVGANELAALIHDNDTVWVVSSGGGINEPFYTLKSIEEKYLQSRHPCNLTLCHSSGMGDKNGGGADRFAHEGMTRKVVGSHWAWAPRMSQMVQDNLVEGYILPQGVMTQLVREIAGGKPGLISHVGLGTFIDPRIEGGKLNDISRENLSEIIEIHGKEWLLYKSFPIDVTIIRGTTADEDGNITMEHEGIILESISAAQAAKNSGGVVIAQVKRVTQKGSLDPRLIKVPGILVDAIVVDPSQMQSSITEYNPAYTGEIRIPINNIESMPLNERKIVARRAAMELFPGAIVNLGFGIPDGVASIAAEEGVSDKVTFTVEQGVIGGVPALGTNFSLSTNPTAIIDEPYQFDWYDGGGLDLTFLSFAEIDFKGDVNVSKFGNKVTGVGGFINISQNSKKVVFCGTFTTSGLAIEVADGKLRILNEGKFERFLHNIRQISFSGIYAGNKGQKVLYVTERAVFELGPEGIMLTEIAPGIDLQEDIFGKMEFKPLVSDNLKLMDSSIFKSTTFNLKSSNGF